ncbi:LexA family protein [Pseudomonas sp. s4]|jgi:SOS-response transcriptional repressor LexA|uniref:LexA family protein n=1 Tax=Pseudomonas TaxID=286 RepID=UPI001CEC1708|nr:MULTISPECIES: S24 family peptidase [Pseudomonas]GJB82483.1 repressor [Aeromonas caviae]
MSELKVHATPCNIERMVQIEELRSAFAARLKQALTARDIPSWGSGARISKMIGVTPKAASKWLNGESMPGGAKMLALATALKVRVEWLEYGKGGMTDETSGFDANVEPTPGPVRYYEYPEISWVQAGMPMEAVEISNVALCEVHPSDAWAGPNGFWLKVKGPSMTSPSGMSFPEGMVILVAPGFDVESSQFVVAKMIDTNEATFKQFIWDSGRAFLKPLNPSFPTVEMDGEWVLVGRVVDAKWPRSVL